MRIEGKAAAFATVLALASSATSAHADDPHESGQGPLYVQGAVGINYWDFPRVDFFGFPVGYSWTGFRPELEFGYHFSGRHDGFVLGIRQSFYVTGLQGTAAGATILRGGWDIPFKAGNFEINVDPFATVGIGYTFDGPHAGIAATGGIDVKIFLVDAFYVMVRPAELGIQCFHDKGDCAFSYGAGVGAGIAFGGH